MATQRYETVIKDLEQYYSPKCPIILAAYAILFDTKERKYGAQLKLKNCSDKEISSVIVSIKAINPYEKLSEEVQEFQYINVNAKPGDFFGSKTFVPFSKESMVKKLQVKIKSAFFKNGDIWHSEEGEILQINMEKLSSSLSEAQIGEYRLLLNPKMKYMPYQKDRFWLCSCGEVHYDGIERCNACGVDKEKEFLYLNQYERTRALEAREEERKEKKYNTAISYKDRGDIDSLRNALIDFNSIADYKDAKEKAEECQKLIEEKRLETERQIEIRRIEEEERKRAIKNKVKKISIAVLLFAVAIGAFFIGIKVLAPNIKYNSAEKLLESGQYDEAEAAFTELGDFKDSEEKIYECKYQKAMSLLSEGKIQDSYELLSTIPTYTDAHDALKHFGEVPVSVAMDCYEYPESKIFTFNIGYDNSGRINSAEMVNEDGEEVYSFSFDENGQVTGMTDHKKDREWSYTYNDDGSVNMYLLTDSGFKAKKYQFDGYGNLAVRYFPNPNKSEDQYFDEKYNHSTDKQDNRNDKEVNNTYKDGKLTSVKYTHGSKIYSSDISYELQYFPDEYVNNHFIWKTFRLINPWIWGGLPGD